MSRKVTADLRYEWAHAVGQLKIPTSQKAALLMRAWHCDYESGTGSRISEKQRAADLKCGRTTIWNADKAAVKAGLLRLAEERSGSSNIYDLVLPDAEAKIACRKKDRQPAEGGVSNEDTHDSDTVSEGGVSNEDRGVSNEDRGVSNEDRGVSNEDTIRASKSFSRASNRRRATRGAADRNNSASQGEPARQSDDSAERWFVNLSENSYRPAGRGKPRRGEQRFDGGSESAIKATWPYLRRES